METNTNSELTINLFHIFMTKKEPSELLITREDLSLQTLTLPTNTVEETLMVRAMELEALDTMPMEEPRLRHLTLPQELEEQAVQKRVK